MCRILSIREKYWSQFNQIQMGDCRACLTTLNDENCVNVTTHVIGEIDVLQAIAEVASLQASHDDLLPKSICKECFNLLRSTTVFRRMIIDSYSQLQHRLCSSSEVKNQGIDGNINYEGQANIKVEEILPDLKIEAEVLSDDFDDIVKHPPSPLENNHNLSRAASETSITSSTDADQMKPIEKDTLVENRNVLDLPECIHKEMKREQNSNPFPKHLDNEKAESTMIGNNRKRQREVNDTKMELLQNVHQIHSEIPNLIKINKLSSKASQACSLCGLMIKGKKEYKIHMKTHNSDIPPLEFVCSICPKRYPKKEYLLIHIRSHTGEKPYHCEICDKHFTQYATYYVHKRRLHDKVIQGTCSYCGKVFVDKPELDVHVKMWHTRERPYLCEFCSATFVCNRTFQRHRREIHSEKKPCQKCGKMLGDSAMKKHLVRHQVLEEGLKVVRKKYTCEYCKSVMNFTSRRRHLEKQHGIKLQGRGDDCTRIPIKETCEKLDSNC